MTHRRSPAASRLALLRCATRLIANTGIQEATLENCRRQAGIRTDAELHLTSDAALLVAVTRKLARVPVLPAKALGKSSDPQQAILQIAGAYRSYVDADAVRQAAIRRLTHATLAGRHELAPALQTRNRSSIRAAATHLHAAGVDKPRAEVVAPALLSAFDGIELCRLVDPSCERRDAAYRDVQDLFIHRLGS